MLSLIWNKAYTGEGGRHYHLGVEKEKKGKCSNLVIDGNLDYYSYSSLVILILIFVYNIV